MKKVFAILTILVVMVSAVFAAKPATPATQKLTVKSIVNRVDPVFQLRGALGQSAPAINTGTPAEETTTLHEGAELVAADITTADIYATIGIFQTNEARNTYGYSLSLTATQLATNDQTPVTASSTPTITGHNPTALTNIDGVAVETDEDVDGATWTYSVRYDNTAAVTAFKLADVTYRWAKDQTAVAGTYYADITLSFTVND